MFCLDNNSCLNRLIESKEFKKICTYADATHQDLEQVASIFYRKSNENGFLSKLEKKIYLIGMKQVESCNIFKRLFSIIIWIGQVVCFAINHLPALPFIPLAFCFMAAVNVTEARVALKEKMRFFGGRAKDLGVLFGNIICYVAQGKSSSPSQ